MLARNDLASVIGEKTLHVKDVRKLAGTVAAYLLEERRTSDLESLIRDIMQYRLDHGVVEAGVISAHELSAPVLADVKNILKHAYPQSSEINLDTKITPEVVGGVLIELPNDQLDMTVRASLDKFKRLTVGGAL